MKKAISVIFSCLFACVIYAQSADVITDMLESSEVTYGHVCYISALQQGLINENTSLDDAIKVSYDKGIIDELVTADTAISAADLAYIYSKLWNVKGGLMFLITKGSPRYAFKQFQADGVIPRTIDPSYHISGAEALSIYTSCRSKYGNFSLKDADMEIE